MTDFNPREVDDVLDQALPIPSEKLAPGSEAPASATVHVWDKDNFGVLFTIRDTNARNLYARMNGLIQTLKNDGWKPDWKTEGSTMPPQTQKSVVSQPSVPSATPDAPICGDHHIPMTWKSGVSKKTNRPYGFWGCNEKTNGEWCTFKYTK